MQLAYTITRYAIMMNFNVRLCKYFLLGNGDFYVNCTLFITLMHIIIQHIGQASDWQRFPLHRKRVSGQFTLDHFCRFYSWFYAMTCCVISVLCAFVSPPTLFVLAIQVLSSSRQGLSFITSVCCHGTPISGGISRQYYNTKK